jgi:hypothetical protein
MYAQALAERELLAFAAEANVRQQPITIRRLNT